MTIVRKCHSCLTAYLVVLGFALGLAAETVFAEGRIVVVGPNQGPIPIGPNERVTVNRTVVINGQPFTIVRVEPMPPKPKFVIGMPMPFPPGGLMYFPYPPDRDEDGVRVSHEVWVNSPGGGAPDNYVVVSVSCRPGIPRCEGCKTSFPPGSILIPDPPQPPGLTMMADRVPADAPTEMAVLGALGLADNPWTEVWMLTTGNLYFYTDRNPPGPPVRLSPASQPADLNCDDVINALDVEPFVQALIDAVQYHANNPNCGYFYADVNDDAKVDGLDIPAFVELLTAG